MAMATAMAMPWPWPWPRPWPWPWPWPCHGHGHGHGHAMAMAQIRNSQLIWNAWYISCNPETLREDLKVSRGLREELDHRWSCVVASQ